MKSLLSIQESSAKIVHLKGNPLMFKTFDQLQQKINSCEELILTDCHSLSSPSLIQLIESCNLLNILRISFEFCSILDDTLLLKLSRSLSPQNLKVLYFKRCKWFTNEGLRKILDSPAATNIKELSLSRCECITDSTLEIIAQSPYLKSLEVLDLTKCYEITTKGISDLVNSENVSMLKKLHLSECWRIKDEALEKISDTPYLRNLEELYLDGLTYITHLGVRFIAFTSNANNLRVLSIANCFLLDDKTLKCFAESPHLSKLQDLDLSHNSKMTSTGIEHLFQSPHLLSLEGLHINDIFMSLRADKAMALSQLKLKRLSTNTEELNYFMKSENADYLQGMTFGGSGKFLLDEKSRGLKKVIIEKVFPYTYDLPVFRNINILCLSLPDLQDETLDLILQSSYSSSLRIIRLNNLQQVSEFGIKKLLSSKELMGNVKVLELRDIKNLSNQCVKVLSKNRAVKLVELRIQGGHEHFDEVRLDTSGLSSLILSPVCTQVKILELTNLRLEEDILKYISISEDMQNLEELILDGNFDTQASSAAKDQQQALKIFFCDQSKLKSLKHLSLKDCPVLTSKAFEEFYQVHKSNPNLPALETLEVDYTDAIQPHVLEKISKNSKSLAFRPQLSLKNINSSQDQERFNSLFNFRCSNSQLLRIELVDIPLLKDQHLAPLADLDSIKLLRTLILTGLPNIHGSFFKEWAKPETRSNFAQLQKIHLMNLDNLQSDEVEYFITEADLQGLIKFEVRSCPLLGNQFVEKLAASRTIKKLYLLVLANLRGVTDAGLSFVLNSQVVNNLRVLELKEIRNLHAETLEKISNSQNLKMLVTLIILNCPQIDSSKLTTIFDSSNLPSLANLTFDNPIVPNDHFLKSFVFTKLSNLVHFSLKFAGDFPRDGILDLLRKPEVHMKHIVLAQLVGNNLETIANDDLISLLIKSDLIDIALSLNINENTEIHPISAKNLLYWAENPGFSLENFMNNYGSLIDNKLLLQMGHWELPQEDYGRRQILISKGTSDESPNQRKSELNTPIRTESRTTSSPSKGFALQIQGLEQNQRADTPMNEAIEGPKFINFIECLPSNYNFKLLPKVTSSGIASIIQYLPSEFDALEFMKNHQEILDHEMLAELVKTKSFQNIEGLSLENFKCLKKESYKLIFNSNNRFFYSKMFELAKSLKFKFDLELLTFVADSREFLNVEIIKIGKVTLELNRFDGVKRLFQSRYNENVRKIEFLDVYATHEPFELLKDSTLKNLEKISIKYAANKEYVVGLKNFASSRKFNQIRNIHFHKCTLPTNLFESIENSPYTQELSEIYISKCTDEGFLISFSKTRNLKKITTLKLKNMFIPSEFFENLQSSNLSIEVLVLHQITLTTGTSDILFLVSQMKNSKIKKLVIDSLKISSKSIESVETNSTFRDLESLSLADSTNRTLKRKATQSQGLVSVGNTDNSRASYMRPSRALSKKATMSHDLSLSDFKKMMSSKFAKSLKELKLLYRDVDDEWIEAMLESDKLENLTSLEFHPECALTAVGIALIFGSRKKLLKKLDFSLLLQKNCSLIDDGLILVLSYQNKLHYLNGLNIQTKRVTTEGILTLLKKLDLQKNPKFKLSKFLTIFKDQVNDQIFEALLEQKFATTLQDLDLNLFKNVQEKSKYKLKVLMVQSDDKINLLLREVPHIVDDELIQTICKSSIFGQGENHDSKRIVNIKLDSNIHIHVTSKGLNTLILKMCEKSFTVYHDWILLEDYWRNMLRPETIRLLANDSICKPESLDLVNELDFENNFYVSTNGYQHLLRKEMKKFQKSQDLEHQDGYLLADTDHFLKKLNNNRFEQDRMRIDDEIGELFLKVIAKCKHLKTINFKNKNLGDKFCRSFSILLGQNSLHFLQEINFGDNPRITSTGFKYLYTAIVGNDSIKKIYLSCDDEIRPDINTIVDDGLYVFTKKKLIAFRKRSYIKYDKLFFIMWAYMIIAFPLALWQIYEDKILQSKKFRQIRDAIRVLETPFIKPKSKHNASILPFSEAIVPYYNEKIKLKAEKAMKENYETEVPPENFYFTKNVIKLNQALQKNRFVLWLYFLNFILYYTVCISVPIIFKGDGCQDGTQIVGFVIYGLYALAIFLFEVYFYNFMVQTLDDRRALRFGIFQFIHLLTSQTSKFDLFTDIVFVTNNYTCSDTGLAIASTIIVIISILFNVVYTVLTAKSIWRRQNPHLSTYINRYAKLSLSLELHTIGTALDKFSTSNCVRIGHVYVSQIMVSAISKFILEDFPQFVLQMIKMFVYSRSGANFLLTLASTILSLILSFRTAMVARPSICKEKQVESLIKPDGKRIGQTNLLEDPNATNVFGKNAPPSKSASNEEEETVLVPLQNFSLAKEQPEQENAANVEHSEGENSSESQETLN